MEWIEYIFNGSISNVVLGVITVCLMAGYWMFVIPMMEDRAKLRLENESLTQRVLNLNETINANNASLSTQLTEITTHLHRLNEALVESSDGVGTYFTTHDKEAQRKYDEIKRDLQQLSQAVNEVGNKQNNINSMLMVTAMTGQHHGTRGV